MLQRFKAASKTIPIVGPCAKHLCFRFFVRPRVSSADYWETRYKEKGDSGARSNQRLAQFKAEVLNEFIRKNAVGSVVELGCGDGAQLALAEYPKFTGIDVALSALEQCRARFAADSAKHFRQTLPSGEWCRRHGPWTAGGRCSCSPALYGVPHPGSPRRGRRSDPAGVAEDLALVFSAGMGMGDRG